jgi:hypothetical protein
MNTTIIKNFLNSFDCETFVIAIIHFDKSKKQYRYKATKEKILNSLPFYKEKNLQDYHIYIRPDTYRVILLDDVTREHLHEIAKLKPCCLVETSPDNYQIWLQTSFEIKDREHSKNICRKLAEEFKADKGSAEPNHVGRFPSFENRKEKYKTSNGFPFVILHKFEKRFSTLTSNFAKDYEQIENNQATNKPLFVLKKPNKTQGLDRSRQDFNTACMYIRQGKDDNFIYEKIKETSLKAGERRDNYILNTIKNAHKVASKNTYHKT